jgi:hypothetical protein
MVFLLETLFWLQNRDQVGPGNKEPEDTLAEVLSKR